MDGDGTGNGRAGRMYFARGLLVGLPRPEIEGLAWEAEVPETGAPRCRARWPTP